jgi:hypothetical protein
VIKERFFARLKRFDELHRLALKLPALTHALRLASYGAYRSLELALGPRHPHGRVLAQARRMTPAPAPAPTAARRILFFTVRGWYVHAGMEAVLAKALELRGATCRFFLCGGGLEQCDFKPGSDPHVTPPLCWRCIGFATRLLDAFALPASTLREVVEPGLAVRAAEIVAALGDDELRGFHYHDLAIGEFVRPSVHRSLLRGDVGADRFSQEVLRGFLRSAVIYVHACERLLERDRPDIVVMTNGLFFCERIMFELARRRGVEVITYERGMRARTALFDRDRPVVRMELDEPWAIARDRPLTADESGALDAYLATRASGRVGAIDLWPTIEHDAEALRRRLGIARDRPLAVAFSNILWDSAVYDRDVGFDGMFDWLAETIAAFRAMPTAQLVLRIHPAEVRIPMSASRDRVMDRIADAFGELPPNVTIVMPDDPASSYALVAMADAVLVYTSTVGLESALRAKRVVVAGRTHYRGRGFTTDLASKARYRDDLRAALAAGPLDATELELARRYAYLFFFRYQQAFPWLVESPRAERRLEFDDLDDLAPGRDPGLDRLCDAILEGRPFVSFEPPR